MNITNYVAIYGALLSTIAIGWNIYNSLQDRPKIKVETSIGFFNSSKGLSEPFLFVKIINKGKRSIHISSFGLRSNRGNLIPNRVTGIPCELKGGTSHNEWFEMEKLRDENYKFAWYRDETEKMYKSKSIKNKLNNYFKSKKIDGEVVK